MLHWTASDPQAKVQADPLPIERRLSRSVLSSTATYVYNKRVLGGRSRNGLWRKARCRPYAHLARLVPLLRRKSGCRTSGYKYEGGYRVWNPKRRVVFPLFTASFRITKEFKRRMEVRYRVEGVY